MSDRAKLAERIQRRIARYRRQLEAVRQQATLAERPHGEASQAARMARLARINAANEEQRKLDRMRPYLRDGKGQSR